MDVVSRVNAQHHVGAVVVSYYPDSDFGTRLTEIADQVKHTIVVDNGSPPCALQALELVQRPDVQVVRYPDNRGIAAALNEGIKALRAMGLRWAVTFDQDSVPDKDMVRKLCETVNRRSDRDRIALAVPNIVDVNVPSVRQRWLKPHSAVRFLFRRERCHDGAEIEVTAAITSGALTNLAVMEAVGFFREDFFIDYVDTEYCLRVLSRRFKVVVNCDATLFHRLGNKQDIRIGSVSFRPSHHSVKRRYYIARNSVPMTFTYGLRFPHWLLFDVCASLYNFAKITVFEKDRFVKLVTAILGFVDGFRRRMGRRF